VNKTALFFMLFSWGIVLSLSAFCFAKLFAAEAQNRKKETNKE